MSDGYLWPLHFADNWLRQASDLSRADIMQSFDQNFETINNNQYVHSPTGRIRAFARRERPLRERREAERANQRANTLLREWLTASQLKELDTANEVTVIGSKGTKYAVPLHGFVTRVDDGYRFCFWPENGALIPAADTMLARIIQLKTDEEAALAVAVPMSVAGGDVAFERVFFDMEAVEFSVRDFDYSVAEQRLLAHMDDIVDLAMNRGVSDLNAIDGDNDVVVATDMAGLVTIRGRLP